MTRVHDPAAATVTLESVDAGSAPAAPARSLGSGARLGGYTIERVIGRGGMGVVYEAFDAGLDRRVALKVLSRSDGPRLVGEARAAAKLSHPNVVSIYEVDVHEDITYFVMELVDGVTVPDWITAAPRTWQQIVQVFVQAAHGIAAAHDANLVHRDIKPSNILVGKDRVRVADFGIARTAGDDDTTPVAGTPRYMAPEQRTDARSDQYSFCVSLHEALAGDVPPAKLPSTIPAWLRRTLARGLAKDPAARFPNMHALVRELSRDRRRIWLIAGAGVLVASAVGVTALATKDRAAVCTGGDLAGTWDAAARARVATAFGKLAPSYAQTIGAEAERSLDRYATAWTATSLQACEAHRDGTQSTTLFDRRMICLDERRRSLQLVVHQLAAVDLPSLDSVLSSIRVLPRVEDCDDLGYVAAGTPSPHQVSEDLMTARLHYVAMRDAEGATAAKRAVDGAHAAGNRVQEAEALVLLGRLQFEDAAKSIDTLARAAELAGSANVPKVRIDAWGHLAHAYMRAGRMPEAREVLDLAFAALPGARDRWREGDLYMTRGVFHGRSGKFGDALADFERARDAYTEIVGPDSHFLNSVHANIAIANKRLGRPEKALEHARKSFELARLLGEDHPATAQARIDVAQALGELGNYQEALAELEAAGTAMRKSLGDGHEQVAIVESNAAGLLVKLERWPEALARYRKLAPADPRTTDQAKWLSRRHSFAQALTLAGKHDEAETIAREVLAKRVALVGATHIDTADTKLLLGDILVARGKLADAMIELAAARTIIEKAFPPDHPDVAEVLHSIGAAERARNQPRAALALDERALAIIEKSHGADHPATAAARLAVARDHLAAGGPDRARPLATAALATFERRGLRARTGAARWLLARSLPATEREQARSLARTARDELSGTDEVPAIDRWLASP
jgi:tetratricopeptide (TPR) repeat protein